MHTIIDYINERKKIILIILIIIIVLIVISSMINKHNENKIYYSESYVYTKDSFMHDNNLISELPYINIIGEEISKINSELIEKYYNIIIVDDSRMWYVTYKNDDIISLIVKIYTNDSGDSYPDEVLIYNINIKTGDVLEDDELLNMYNISRYDVSEIIMSEIKDYYLYELKKGYVDSDCSFDCYLEGTNSLPFDNCKYYVKDNRLMAYKSINLGYGLFYDVSSGFNLFNFEIAKK